ncbi:MAG TPA: RES family NAD+ phosphorylase [Acetobacteraceae bacterium]|nr:RES family NAD+ phosphorylase [Acetobacteraceae bacterium]
MVLTPPLKRVEWPAATRIIASRYPPIDLYERVSPDPAVWEALIAAEMLTNPRVRDEVGDIRLVPAEERISGPGASYVMAPFTHLNPKGGRFSDATHGAYYAASDLPTAIAETAYHFARFAADSSDGPRYEDMRVIVGRIDAELHDVEQLDGTDRRRLLDPLDYTASQAFAYALREAGSTGLHYPSVRRVAGRCVALFRPSAVGLPVQAKHLKYHWDGTAVRRYFDYETDAWMEVEPAP